MTPSSSSVLIVGAGPAGLCLALSLVQNSISVRIIDKLQTYRIGRKGMGVQPRTLELHKFLGTLDEVLKKGAPTSLLWTYDPLDGTKIVKTTQAIPVDEVTPSCPYPNLLCIGQDHHEAIFRSRLEALGVFVELSTELVSFEEKPDRVVAHMVSIRDGEKVAETAEFHWLVGADGASSMVRKQLNLKLLGETRDEGYTITGDIFVEKGLSTEAWHIWGSMQTQLFSLFAAGSNLFTFNARLVDTEKAKQITERQELIDLFYEITGRRDVEFGELRTISLWKPNIRMVDSFGRGRVFITGDASHVHSPSGGQGLNSGLQDSFNLGWKLALVEKGLAPQSLLDSYNSERIPVIAAMLNKTTLLLDKRAASTAKDGSNFSRGKEFKQLGVNYRGSSILVDEFSSGDDVLDPYGVSMVEGGPLRAGDRAPDAPGLLNITESDVTSLFDTFGTSYHSVLIFSDDIKVQEEILLVLQKYPSEIFRPMAICKERLGQMIAFRDTEGHAAKAYNPEGRSMIVVVRPDGVIGAIVGGLDGLLEYLKRVFK
ncbi:FAD binding domain-containing protein [Mycena floridula]|nr:FAD binding domain-containing protein [Mycena floridula]